MGYYSLLIPSLVITTIIGVAAAAMWKAVRSTRVLGVFVGAAAVVHLIWLAVHHLGPATPVARWLISVWVAAMAAAALLLVPFLLLTMAAHFARWRAITSRRLMAAYATVTLVPALIVSVPTTADFIVRHETVALTNLPAALDGLRIGHIADVHIGDFFDATELQRLVDASDDNSVDLLVFSGDLIDDPGQLEATMHAIEGSRAPHVIASILGNHEKSGDMQAVLAAYARHSERVRLLVDQSLLIEHNGEPLRIAGVDYAMGTHGNHMLAKPQQDAAMGASAARAFADVKPGETLLALSHHPDFFPFAAEYGAPLTLASHTHGGQVKLFGRPVIAAYDHMHGRYRRGNAHLDVSAGAGHWLPIRFGVPREIVILTLRSGG